MIAVFDGDCGVCDAFARYIARRAPVSFIPYQRADEAWLATLGIDEVECSLRIQLFTPQGRKAGAEAINTLLCSAHPWISPMVSCLERSRWFMRLESGCYAVFASQRARLSLLIGLRTCKVSAPG